MTSTLSLTGHDGRIKKLFPKDWLAVVELAEKGREVADIAKIYNVDKSVIYKGLRKRKVNITAAAQRAAMEQAEIDKQSLITKIRETKDFQYRSVHILEQLCVKTVLEASKTGHSLAGKQDDVRTIKLALDAVKTGFEIKWKVFGSR